jgi:hypothetical protein
MDYIYIAANALCAGFRILLALWHRARRGPGLNWRHYALCAAGSLIYYGLGTWVFTKWLWVYYLANTLPVLLVASLLGWLLWPNRDA